MKPRTRWGLTTDEAAFYLGFAAATLVTWRSRGGGPPYHKRGGRIFYRKDDLDNWMVGGRRENSSSGSRLSAS